MKQQLLGLVALLIVELFQSFKIKRTERTNNCKLTERENFLTFLFLFISPKNTSEKFPS